MGKRVISDVINYDDSVNKPEVFSRKKSRKEKTEKTRKPTTHDLSTPVAYGNTADEAGSYVEVLGSNVKNVDTVVDDQLSKAEKKAAKKARKEAKEAKKAQRSQSHEDGNTITAVNTEDDENTKAARKAARKAEKKRLKELTRAEATRDDSTPTVSNVSSTLTSALASRVESSATSPEPTEGEGISYTEHPRLSALPQADIDAFLISKLVTIDDPLPSAHKLRPIIKFSYLPHTSNDILAPFASFTEPTPIQAATWPALFSGRDMVGVAETGSGKTLAFGVPCVRFISSLPKKEQKGVKAVIVSPTRELACQIEEQLVKLATPANLSVVCVYGGVPKDPQAQALRKAHIVVATPGRLNDLIGDGSADLSNASYVVLDEADRMLDKGFEEPIRQIIKCTPKKRQTLMFTATWPPSVRELASTFMQSPVRINIGDNPTGELRANMRIKQLVEVVLSFVFTRRKPHELKSSSARRVSELPASTAT
jgi:ATP-dependent RNA helicase DBP3